MRFVFWFAFAAAALCSIPAQAQTAPISRTIPVTFTGVVSSTAADTLLVRQPDGSFATFAGELPALPYLKGDPVTISFTATLPTRDYYDSGVYRGQIAADGIYRITLTDPYYSGGITPGGIGGSSVAEVSGPINSALYFGQRPNTRMTIVYDYNSDSYSIEGSGNFLSAYYEGPGYLYDAASGKYVACKEGSSVPCVPSASYDPIRFALSGNADGTAISSGTSRVLSTDPTSGIGTGFFSWLFSGSWNLPQFGGATAVPEPGMLGMFGGGFAVLVWRRRRRKT